MPVLQLPTHKARFYQKPLWAYLEGGGKRAVCCWHRRAGKDDVAASWISVAALESQPAVYWHMLPEYAQARKALWTAVNPHSGMRRIDEWFPQAIRKATREQQMEIEFVNGSLYQVVGSDSYDSLVGASVKGVVGSEWALARPEAWAYFRPILLENNGWAVFISTPRGRNHFYDMYNAAEGDPTWFAQRLTAYDTGIFSPEALERERAELIRELGQDDGDAKFRQEYLVDWAAALVGAYYTHEFSKIDEEGRLCDVPYDPQYPVYTAWDLGVGQVGNQTAIWFAQVDDGGAVRIIDFEIGGSGMTVEHYAKVVMSKPYVYAKHILPHDSERTDWSAIGAQQRAAVLAGLGVKPVETLPPWTKSGVRVEDGIQAVRRLLPRCRIDKTKCKIGVAHLREYRRTWNESAKRFDPKPFHGPESDSADAFRYLALGLPTRLALSPAALAQRRRDRGRDVSSSEWSF